VSPVCAGSDGSGRRACSIPESAENRWLDSTSFEGRDLISILGVGKVPHVRSTTAFPDPQFETGSRMETIGAGSNRISNEGEEREREREREREEPSEWFFFFLSRRRRFRWRSFRPSFDDGRKEALSSQVSPFFLPPPLPPLTLSRHSTLSGTTELDRNLIITGPARRHRLLLRRPGGPQARRRAPPRGLRRRLPGRRRRRRRGP
jgi:hypothetical protein